MNLSDHLRPLLRDHDCVIIPDFGGLVAEDAPARVQPGSRHHLSPPTRQVAFNQALTRNDGLLVDALREHLGLPAAAAREALRQAVAQLHHELQAQQRTELPGIGVFRQVAGRGLQFEYTGADNLLAAAFGLPELTAHPVRVTDARLAREQQAQLVPRLRAAGRSLRLRRLVPGAAIGLLAGLAVAGLYLVNLHPTALPVAWRGYIPRWESAAPAPQQATLVHTGVGAVPSPVSAPVAAVVVPSAAAVPMPTPAPAKPVAEPAVGAPARVVAPTTPKQKAPAKVAAAPVRHAAPDPVEALLARPVSLPKMARSAPSPALARIVVKADEENIARPMPAARRTFAASAAKAPAAALPGASAPAAPAAQALVVKTPASKAPVVARVPFKKAPAPVVAKPVGLAAGPAAPARPVVKVLPSKAVTLAPAAAPAAAPAGVAAAAGPTTVNSRTGRFYVIVAAYSSLRRAEEGRRNLVHAGRPAKVILPPPGSRLFRLSAVDFADRPTALATAARLRQNPHFDKGLTILPY